MRKYKSKNLRVHLTLEQKRFIVLQREKKKTMNEITQDVYKEFGIKTTVSVVHRLCQQKERVLKATENMTKASKNKKGIVLLVGHGQS